LYYFGFSKEAYSACKKNLLKHNLLGLSIVSVATAILIIIFSFYPGTSDPWAGKKNSFLFALIQLLIFVYSRILAANKVKSNVPVFAGIGALTLNLIAFSLYVCLIEKNVHVIRFLVFFCSFEIVFIFNFLFSLTFNVIIVLLFSLSYYFSENLFGVTVAAIQNLDPVNVMLASLVSMIFNCYVSYIFIKSYISTHLLEEERNRYQDLSLHDELTGLNNRRNFENSVDFFTTICRNVHQTICIVMMDIDFFKNYNDYYGHTKGDEVLHAIGKVLKFIEDEFGIFTARVGGEEFIAMWTENRMIEAERVVLRIRQEIIKLQIPHAASKVAPYLTASFGLYVMRGGSKDSASELYAAADHALYKAKESGRDKIVILDSNDGSFRELAIRNPNELPER